jgi:hypothetical protein
VTVLLLFRDTDRSAALRHELPVPIIDPLLFCELDGRQLVLTSDLERARIAAVRPQAEILDYFSFGLKELRESGIPSQDAEREIVARLARHLDIRQAIVASVWNGFGHEAGHGPLPAGLPIVVDLWSQDEASACWADMTRTFVVGEPSEQAAELITEQEQLVHVAHDAALAAVRPGVTGRGPDPVPVRPASCG